MDLKAGYCVKCGNAIQKYGKVKSNYNELLFEMDGIVKYWRVGICTGCTISPAEYDELLVEAHKVGVPASSTIKELNKRLTLPDVLKEVQNNTCPKCDKKFSNNETKWIVTNSRMQHERCE